MLVSIPKEMKEILIDIVEKIKGEICFTRIILFGSYANGSYNNQSDLDIAIFIKNDTIRIIDAYRHIQKICTRYEVDVQPQIFYEREYHNPCGIVEEITQFGIEITNLNLQRYNS